ncbi:hypothetical protein DL95DRAFT_518480 [Leptodontidium sp. 2 PMI_412]|nr:hypothetical protein DL95DRAFT_518480 [Leptodontidium sp. 2 PMI_412]
MLRINYYISGHGYGHATRSAQLISALLSSSPTTHVTIITTAPTYLFPASSRVSFISQEVDSAIIQPQPYTIDAATSFANLAAFLATAETQEWQAKMDAILEETECNLVLADAPYPIAWAGAKTRGIKSLLVSNFTFDAIFEKLLTYLPASERDAEREMVDKIEKLYAGYDYAVRLPGYIPFPFAENYWSQEDRERRLIDVPLVFRPARKVREEVLEGLGVPREMFGWRVLLVQFGGQALEESGGKKVPNLPKGWICLSSEDVDDERFFKFPKDVYSPDLVGVADVVLGKIGYGTVSECVGMNKALVYVLRPMFAEEPGLLQYMRENETCEEISVAEYEAGNWASTIERAVNVQEGSERVKIDEGSSMVARMVETLARDM